MNGRDRRVAVIAELVDHFEQSGFEGSYAVLNGIYPDGRMGRDVDLLCAPSTVDRLSQITIEFLESKHISAIRYQSPWGIMVIGHDDSHLVPAIEVDFNREFFWGLTSLIAGAPEMPTKKVCGVPCAVWEAFAKRVLLQFLSGNMRRFRSAKKVHEFAIFPTERLTVYLRLTEIFGEKKAAELVLAIDRRDWEWFSENRWRYCGRFSWWGLMSSPLGVVRSIGLRLRVKKWQREAPQVVPEVICIADDINRAREFSGELKDILTRDYVFSSIVVEPFVNSQNFLVKKKKWKKKQRLLGLLVLYSDHVPDCADAATSIIIKPEVHCPKRAGNLVIARHFELVRACRSFR